MNRNKKFLSRELLMLIVLSVISASYYICTNENSLCMRLFNAAGRKEKLFLIFVLSAALVVVVEVGKRLIAKLFSTVVAENDPAYGYAEKAAAGCYLLTLAKLFHAAYFPGVIWDTGAVCYLIPRLAVYVYLAVLALAFVFSHEKGMRAILVSVCACCLGWGIGRLAQASAMAHGAVYYLTVVCAVYSVLRLVFDFSFRKLGARILRWCADNKLICLIPIAAIVLGYVVEKVDSACTLRAFLWNKWVFWTIASACLMGCMALYRRTRDDSFTEKAFLLIILSMGLYMALFQPATTLVSWDDETHYSNMIYHAQGRHGSYADNTIMMRLQEKTFSYSQILKNFETLDQQAQSYMAAYPAGYNSMLTYKTVGYLPQCLGIWVGQILNLSFPMTYLMGRLGGIVVYAFVMYAAMRKLKAGKMLLAVIALFPTNVFQASNYSYDAFIVCMVAFGIAWFIGIMQREDQPITNMQIFGILAVLVIAIAPKGVYFPLIVLLSVLPKSRFESAGKYKKYQIAVWTTAVACFVVYMVLPLFQGQYVNDTRGGTDVNSKEQILFILTNPIQYAKILLEFLKGYLSPENSYQMVSFMAYLNGKDVHTIMYALMLAAAMIDRTKGDKHYDNSMTKIWSALVVAGTVVLIATVLYISYTPVASNTIQGCQPRYLAPLMFPFFALCGNFCQVKISNRNRVSMVILAIAAFAGFSCVWSNVANMYGL